MAPVYYPWNVADAAFCKRTAVIIKVDVGMDKIRLAVNEVCSCNKNIQVSIAVYVAPACETKSLPIELIRADLRKRLALNRKIQATKNQIR